MKARLAVVAIILASVLFVAGVNTAKAQWPAIKQSGYAITTNWHKIEIPLGALVVATAGTTDLTILTVTFRWHAPNGTVIFQDTVNVVGPITTPTVPPNVPQEVIDWANANPGVQYLYAQSTHEIPTTLDIVGDWGVQAFFQELGGRQKAGVSDVIQIRATSFNVVPEAPIGTTAILLSMFGALSVFALRKRRTTAPDTKLE